MRTGTATLPLHWGKAPPWLFNRMKKLAREIILIMLRDYSSEELLNRLSDPFRFRAFGCILGFDWHSSGLTTTVCGALKEAMRGIEHETGFFVAGGKDGHPYPVARDVYDGTIQFLKEIVNETNIGPSDKKQAFRQLASFYASG